MYLKINEVYDFHEITDIMNFQKPHVIRGGCKNMKIVKQPDKLDFLKKKLNHCYFPTEVYDSIYDMGNTDIKKTINKNFEESVDHILKDKKTLFIYS